MAHSYILVDGYHCLAGSESYCIGDVQYFFNQDTRRILAYNVNAKQKPFLNEQYPDIESYTASVQHLKDTAAHVYREKSTLHNLKKGDILTAHLAPNVLGSSISFYQVLVADTDTVQIAEVESEKNKIGEVESLIPLPSVFKCNDVFEVEVLKDSVRTPNGIAIRAEYKLVELWDGNCLKVYTPQRVLVKKTGGMKVISK